MIKFFRNIRRQLLIEKKSTKYFKYAIGEILLVMIGILLALQVNNWNEKTQNKKSLNTYLTTLQKENKSNLYVINFRISALTEDISLVNNYLTNLNTERPDQIHDSILISLVRHVGPIRIQTLEDAVYKELLNSNLLSTLKEGPFKRKMFMIKEQQTRYTGNIEEVHDIWINELRPYYVKHGSLSRMRDSVLHVKIPKTFIKINRKAFINNNELNNILMNRNMMNMRAIQTFTYVKERIESVNEDIKNFVAND